MVTPLFIASTFLAGILMFLAPCTLPLLPAYLGFISDVAYEDLAAGASRRVRWKVFLNALSFVVGFSLIFVLFGTFAGVAGSVLAPVRTFLTHVGGAIILVFGLFMIGVLKLPFLAKERRVRLPRLFTIGTPISSFALGSVFAFGWTPCIGPIMGTVLFMASSKETMMTGAFLLLVFSCGFALPFLLLATLVGQATRFVEKATPYLHAVSVAGGVVLLMLGLNLLIGDTFISSWFFDLIRTVDFESVLFPYL